MSFQVQREEHLEKVRLETTELLQSTRNQAMPAGRFDWLYRSNPDGEAVLWSIRDADRGELAGFAVALPRRMLVDGQQRTAWNTGDFSVRQSYRTLGVALKLRRAAKQGVDAGSVDFLYSHPNERMEIIHSRVGHRPVGRMIRLAKVLRADPYVGKRVRPALLARALAFLADPLLAVWSPERRHRARYPTHVVEHIGFDGRFDELFDEARGVRPVIGVRDARYLNWRHAQNPLGETRAVLAEQSGRLRGYVLFHVDAGVAHVKDVFAAPDAAIQRDLLAELVRYARGAGLAGISAVLLEGNPWLPPLEEFGFVQRLRLPHLYCHAAPQRPWAASVGAAGNWFMTAGDRDL